MLDHLLPLIYREFEYFDEANKENYGYVIRRRARPVSSTVSTPSRTLPRPPRCSSVSSRMEGGVVSSRSLKRRREVSDNGEEERGDDKKKMTTQAKKEEKQEEKTRGLKRQREASDDGNEERGDVKKQRMTSTKKEEKEEKEQEKEEKEEFVAPLKKTQEPKIPAKKAVKKVKKSKKMKKMKVTVEEKKSVKVSKSATPKRIPLQDITHLYVNDHTRAYEQQQMQQRERFVAGLTTSVAIRFF